jgi:hypothetical protein
MSLRKQVEAAGEMDPMNPIITEAPKRDDISLTDSTGMMGRSNSTGMPSTPTGSQGDGLAQPIFGCPRTPQSASMEAEVSMTEAASASSPYSIDNADLDGKGLPSYPHRNTTDEYDLHKLALGCGAAFFQWQCRALWRKHFQSKQSHEGIGSHDARIIKV